MSLVDTSFGFVKYCISKATTSICPKSHKVLQTNFKVGPELNRKNGCEKILCTAEATHFKFAGNVPSPTYLQCTNLQVTKETEHYTVQPQKNIDWSHFSLSHTPNRETKLVDHTHCQLSHTAVSQFCVQLTKAYEAETPCKQIAIDSAMYMLKISSARNLVKTRAYDGSLES